MKQKYKTLEIEYLPISFMELICASITPPGHKPTRQDFVDDVSLVDPINDFVW